MSMEKITRGSIAAPGTTLAYKTGSWRIQRPLYQHRIAPCHGACPAGEDPQAYIALLDEGHPRAAWEKLVSVNPLPAITGRVCPHPCESGCNRGEYDEPLAIHSIERHLGDQAIALDWPYPVSKPAVDAPRIAVVGAGPAGLSAAYHGLRGGLNVTLYSAVPEPGGTLHAIPGYRLPREVIEQEVARLLATGIDFRPNQRLGRDFYLDDLEDEYLAVFLAPGTQLSREWSIQGVTPPALHEGLHLLKEWMAVGEAPVMKSAAVVGGGNTAVDVARVLKCAGVPEVHIVTHNGLPGPDTLPEDAMRAIPREIAQAQEEGIQIHDHRGIHRLILRGKQVTGVEMTRMKKIRDANGRLQRVAFEGTESILHVDQVIPAIGQMVNPAGLENIINGDRYLAVDEWCRIPDHPGLYAGGDACGSGRGTVTAAVGDGRRAAEAMLAALQARELPAPAPPAVIACNALNTEYFEPAQRFEAPLLPVEQRTCEEEIEGALSREQAQAEAKRCFSCGSCMSCDNCWTLCPDSAVLKTRTEIAHGGGYVFDYDYCKGCGLCAHECPTGYIAMVEES